jgi:hypothetical protein
MCHSSIRETDFEDPCASPRLEEIVSEAHPEGYCGTGYALYAISAIARGVQAGAP